MAKHKTIMLDRATMELVAALSTLMTANLLCALYNRQVINDDDIDQIIADTGSASLGDPAMDAMAKTMADTLGTQLRSRLN